MNIENYFVSNEFMNALIPLYGKVKEDRIDDVIQFIMSGAINFSSSNDFSIDGVDEYVRCLVREVSKQPNKEFKYVGSPLIKFEEDLSFRLILKRLGYTEEDLSDVKVEKKVSKYIIEKFRIQKYRYHSFNDAFYESIVKNGINPKLQFSDQDTLNRIDEIFSSHDISMILGWQKLNCVDMVSYAKNPSECYSYALASPEWFSEFCGESLNFANIEGRCQFAFRDNDYDGAKRNLISLMKKHNFSYEEMKEVLNFFDDNWEKYANKSSTLVVVVDRDYSTSIDTLYKRFCDLRCSVKDLFRICSCSGSVDEHTEDVIDVSDAKFIKMPDHKVLVKKLSADNVLSKLQILRDAKIYFDVDDNGKKVLVSQNGEDETKIVKLILCDDSVLNYILDNDTLFDSWIPYFSYSLLNKDDNVVKIAQRKPLYFSYISEEQRNNVTLMRRCVSGECVHKDIVYLVGSEVLDDLEFVTKLLIKISYSDFDFVGYGLDNIEGSKMAYGKLFGRSVQMSPNFWELLNSKIKFMNKKYKLDTPLFDESREIVIASRYFDSEKAKKN